MYKRPAFDLLCRRLSEPRRFIQVLAGPRQTGKTTVARQVLAKIRLPSHYNSADEPSLKSHAWIEQQWETGRALTKKSGRRQEALLALDEIHKITGWSETVKRLWDEDAFAGTPLQVVLLGSSPLLVQRGLAESLAGRFEIIHVTHWPLSEMKKAFGWKLDEYIYYGGYPGAAGLIKDRQRWARYILDSLIETSISRDLLLMTRVDKPALLRQLFELGCAYSGQILSYQKMLGQLQDAGNTTTLAHYLQLLQGAGLLYGLSKYSERKVRQRGSSPKFLTLNTALMTAASPLTIEDAKQDSSFWGRLVESAVGSHLANNILGKGIQLFYWAGHNQEVDFILCRGKNLTAIEVKSGRPERNQPGIESFSRQFKTKKKLLVGSQGIPLEDFLITAPESWLE